MPTGHTLPSPGGQRLSVESGILQARARITAGDLAGARRISDAILAEFPLHPGVLIQRSRLESIEDNYRAARGHALSACRVGVQNKRQCMQLLRRLKTFNLSSELLAFIPRIPAALLLDIDVATLVALLLQTLNRPGDALQHLQAAAAAHPDPSASLQSDIGLALLNLGRFDEAELHLRESLRISPDHAPAWWHLARLRERGPGPQGVEALRDALGRARDPGDSALMAFALHRELDALGEHGEAADALDLACTSMRKVVAYSREEDARLFAMLKSLPSHEVERRGASEDAPFTPVFIVGMHRSGTTLLEQLLSGHDDICQGGELYDFTSQLRFAADHHCSTELDPRIVEASDSFDYDAIGRGYLESVDWRRSGERFVTDKLPSNFLNIGFILRALPHARILHMSRDPLETCFSNLREPFSENTCRYSHDQAELADYYGHYFGLMQHWRQRFPGRIHDVTYAALATDTAAELKRVTAYLGTDFQPVMLEGDSASASVNTASAVQVRRKPGLPLRPKWQAYSEYLTPLQWRLSQIGQRY